MASQVVTTAVQESMALDQALLGPSSVARRVQKDGAFLSQSIDLTLTFVVATEVKIAGCKLLG